MFQDVLYWELLDFCNSNTLENEELLNRLAADELRSVLPAECVQGHEKYLPQTVKHLPEHIHVELERRLVQRCRNVVGCFYGNDSTGVNDDLIIAKAMQLTNIIAEKQDSLKRIREEIPQLEDSLIESVLEYIKSLQEMTAKMEVLIREFICKHDLENNLAFNSYFSLIVDNMRLKIKCMRYELIARIYPKSVVEKLETKRRQFEEDIAEIRKQTKRAECELRQYENIGQEFHTLVNDYQEILSQITQANRDIQMLQQ